MTSYNVSKSLDELSNDEVKRQIPLMIYLIVMCITRICGNMLVCYIFARKYTESTYRIFVIALSIIDSLICCVSLPLQFFGQLIKYKFDDEWLCRIGMFVNTWTTICSCCFLFCIAIDRYRKVCSPLRWQVSITVAKLMCLLSVVTAFSSSWISSIIYGIQEMKHGDFNVTIVQCAVTEDMTKTPLPLINNILFAILFFGSFIITFTFYIRIALRVRQQERWKNRSKGGLRMKSDDLNLTSKLPVVTTVGQKEDKTHEPDVSNSKTNKDAIDEPAELKGRDDTNQSNNKQHTLKQIRSSKKQYAFRQNKQPNSHKAAYIMFMVSLVAIVSFIPVLSLLFIRSVDKTFVESLDNTERTVYNFFLRSYLVNSAINPLIYGIFDAKFRNSCKMICTCKY